jgi:WD40 repeat protein
MRCEQINRQYVFGPDHGSKFSIPAEEPRDKKNRIRSISRVPSTNHDRDMQNGSPAEPPARRAGAKGGKRKSGGGEKRVNGSASVAGDAMDVDSTGTAPHATATVGTTTENGTTVGDAESPLPAIDELPPISTLEIGESKGTITEKPRDLTSSTCFVDLPPSTLLEQVTWSPHNRTALVTAGRNHMRVFKVGANDVPPDNVYTRATNVHVPSDDFEVRAFCWTEKGSGAFTTLEKIKNEDGDEMVLYKMLGFTDYGQKLSLVDATAGFVLALKYNAESELLVSLSWGEQAHVKVWSYTETIYENSKRRVEPKFELRCSKTLPAMLYAVEWTAPNRFMVCGRGALQLYEVGSEDVVLVKSVQTEREWVRMEWDPVWEVGVVHNATEEEGQAQVLGVITGAGGEGEALKLQTHTLEYKITDLAFQPPTSKASPEEATSSSTSNTGDQNILAIASDDGSVYLYNALSSPTTTLQPPQRLEMGNDAIAQALSFSPDGFLLAAGGYDTLNVWKTAEALAGSAQPKCVWSLPGGANERWRTDVHVANGEGEGEEGQEGEREAHKLGWDADGKRIAFGFNGQVAVIRL